MVVAWAGAPHLVRILAPYSGVLPAHCVRRVRAGKEDLPMARKPNYSFERMERERADAKKAAEKAAAKAEKRAAARGEAPSDEPQDEG